jgi:ABC-2 type transport system ATP-binding protein
MKNNVVTVSGIYKDFNYSSNRSTTLKSLFMGLHKKEVNKHNIQHALKDINFEIAKGEFFGIVGRNGSGKSTLLKIIAGIYQPSKGKVSVMGKLVPFIELGVGFNPDLTGKENVYMNGALLGFNVKEVEAFYDEVVEFAELEKFMDKKLKNYSSGMQVRLAFSMAIRANADILLVDEVLAVGDADFQRKCFRYFKALKRQKKTVVFVTHDMNAIREYCDRAILIEKQEVVLLGSPEVVAKKYEKLLQPKEDSAEGIKDSNKWGDKTVVIETPKVVYDDDNITLTCILSANKNCDDLIAGFLVKKQDGNVLFGTNTMIEKLKIQPLRNGDIIKLTWSMPNVLAEGDYTVTIASQYDGGNTTSMWWEDAVNFSIISSRRTPYAIQPKYKTNYKKLGK